jgi:hypothetical protein
MFKIIFYCIVQVILRNKGHFGQSIFITYVCLLLNFRTLLRFISTKQMIDNFTPVLSK